jgi:hypothetical protein
VSVVTSGKKDNKAISEGEGGKEEESEVVDDGSGLCCGEKIALEQKTKDSSAVGRARSLSGAELQGSMSPR